MNDTERAKAALPGHSLALCRGERLLTHDGRGISPMLELLGTGQELSGFSAADTIVGKAAAMLFVRAGVRAVYGVVMSRSALAYLTRHDIAATYGTLTDTIRNRAGTGICPMEETVQALDDPDAGYRVLAAKLAAMRAAKS